MDHQHAEYMQRLSDAVLTTPGETDPRLRRAIEAYAARLGGQPGTSGQDELPEELAAYVTKVALHAYKITDENVLALLQAGYSEDAIFEITLSAALGASKARLERGLAALKGSV